MSHDGVFGICKPAKCLVEVAPKTFTDILRADVDELIESTSGAGLTMDSAGNMWMAYNAVYDIANDVWTKIDNTKKSTAICLTIDGEVKMLYCDVGSSVITWTDPISISNTLIDIGNHDIPLVKYDTVSPVRTLISGNSGNYAKSGSFSTRSYQFGIMSGDNNSCGIYYGVAKSSSSYWATVSYNVTRTRDGVTTTLYEGSIADEISITVTGIKAYDLISFSGSYSASGSSQLVYNMTSRVSINDVTL